MDNKLMLFLKAAVQPQKMLHKDSVMKSLLGTLLPMATLTLFFLQVGLDKKNIGIATNESIAVSCIFGALSAAAFIFIAAGIINAAAFFTHVKISYPDLAFTSGFIFEIPFVINLIGTLCNLVLRKGTSLTFGVTGLLMMILPLYYLIVSINLLGTKYRKYFAVTLSAVICAIGLTGWTILIQR